MKLETELLEKPLVLCCKVPLLEHLLHIPLGGSSLGRIGDADLSLEFGAKVNVIPSKRIFRPPNKWCNKPGGHQVPVVNNFDEWLELCATCNLLLTHPPGHLLWGLLNSSNDTMSVRSLLISFYKKIFMK